ncbi:MAG TPA: hypothetical protein VFU62_07000 [Hanamia sp.]|nr:hypothetical protein [Hanamia sp.]
MERVAFTGLQLRTNGKVHYSPVEVGTVEKGRRICYISIHAGDVAGN